MEQEALKGDAYQTIVPKTHGEALLKEKGSKFYAYAFHAKSVEEVQQHLENLKKKFHDARHFCYAYRLQPEKPKVRANDDGEPNNSAGVPIFNQLQAFDVWNVLVVVVRYFGGTKLGVGGLVQAYKTAAGEALENAKVQSRFLTETFEISYPYSLTAEVMRIIKNNNLTIINEKMGKQGGYKLAVKKDSKTSIFEQFKALYPLKLTTDDHE